MKYDLAVFLWRRRISARTKTSWEGLKLIVDGWTALYIVLPALIILVYTWLQLLAGLPGWFIPAGEVLLAGGLGYFMASGRPRSYLNETDLTFLQPNSREFHRLFRIGFFCSLALNNLWIVLLLTGLFPFYLHLEAVSVHVWLGLGLWLLILRTAFWQTLFLIQSRVGRWGFRLLFFTGFLTAWNRVIMPFIHTRSTAYLLLMLGIALLMVIIAGLVMIFWPVDNWARLVREEADYDIQLMGRLLGYAARPVRKRSGGSIWSKYRLAIPFRSKYTLTYFYMKYFFRLKIMWQLFMEIAGVCLLVGLSSLPYGIIVCFTAAGDLLLGLLVRSMVAGNHEKLDLYTKALDHRDRINGLRNLYIIMMIPLAVIPLLSGLAGIMNLVQVLGGIFILVVWVLIAARQLVNFSGIH